MEVKRVGGIDERCLVILSDCPKCGNNEYIVPPKIRVFDKSIKKYYPKCSKCNTLYNGKTLEKNLITKPTSLGKYTRIFEKGIGSPFVSRLIELSPVIPIGLVIYLRFSLKIEMFFAVIISFIPFFILVVTILFIKTLLKNSKICPVCKQAFETFVYQVKTDDLFSKGSNYHFDKNNNVIESRGGASFFVCDIWNICESCKTCQLSEMRVASKVPIYNSKEIYNSTKNLKKKDLQKNNISNENNDAKNKKELGKDGKLTKLVTIIKDNSDITAIYADRNTGGVILCLIFAIPVSTLLLAGSSEFFQKNILDFNISDNTVAIYAFIISTIYWFFYGGLQLKNQIIININEEFLVVREEFFSLKLQKKVKVICSIAIDNILQLYVYDDFRAHKRERIIASQAIHIYHLKIKTKVKEEIILIENGERYDLIKLEDYLEDYLEIEDVIVSDKEVLSK